MKIQNHTPSFKARTTIISHNNILSGKQIARLKQIGEAIGTDKDTIYFNVRNFKKTKRVITYEAKLIKQKEELTASGDIMSNKWFLKPEKFIQDTLLGINRLLKKK